MEMLLLQDGIIAFLAAVGLTALVWLLIGLLPRLKKPRVDALLVVRAKEAGALEYNVHELEGLRAQLGRDTPIVMVDCGLDEEGRSMAAMLIGEERDIMLCAPEELQNYLT
ncbi:MAG: hypothetical protein VB023_09790 [Oscillibacter sp.]|nr:hypothetical protein [Oscillibacter sp.]